MCRTTTLPNTDPLWFWPIEIILIFTCHFRKSGSSPNQRNLCQVVLVLTSRVATID